MKEVSGLARVMLAMARNEAGAVVPCWTPEEKKAVKKLEKLGLVKVEKTKVLFAGLVEWRFQLVEGA